ncbi:hypothetical protein [uncultured Dokdonia sp.]|uniref:hypothetical protein n=1 Tax=uncultured Dokdonia sp. TaxID=575653 RepID=UPI002633C72E|nr:hypothetical protein [uncultured Dokdonia sp.]
MDKNEFLEKHIFTDLQKIHQESDADTIPYFSEADFAVILERIEHFGIGIYGIEPWFEGKFYDVKTNEAYRKKATDPKWYKRAFFEFKKQQANLQYAATYRISDKLLAKETIEVKETKDTEETSQSKA